MIPMAATKSGCDQSLASTRSGRNTGNSLSYVATIPPGRPTATNRPRPLVATSAGPRASSASSTSVPAPKPVASTRRDAAADVTSLGGFRPEDVTLNTATSYPVAANAYPLMVATVDPGGNRSVRLFRVAHATRGASGLAKPVITSPSPDTA